MTEVAHRIVQANGIEMHLAETGWGPPVILCHGFPALWWSWRRQLPVLGAEGFHAVAPDMRGYGRTEAPPDPSSYSRKTIVEDILAVFDLIGADDAVLVGHDWGAFAAWEFAQRHPERLRGLVVLSQNFRPRRTIRPTEAFRQIAEQQFFHMHYFQEPGVADRELADNPRLLLAGMLWALSGQAGYGSMLHDYARLAARRQVRGCDDESAPYGYLEVLPDPPRLPWSFLTPDEFEYYVAEFSRTGFTGGLNWYRAEDQSWAEAETLHDRVIEVPTCFIAGTNDVSLALNPDWQRHHERYVPGLRRTVLVPGAGHYVQLEEPEIVNREIVEFIRSLD